MRWPISVKVRLVGVDADRQEEAEVPLKVAATQNTVQQSSPSRISAATVQDASPTRQLELTAPAGNVDVAVLEIAQDAVKDIKTARFPKVKVKVP
jgi:hypothetical protein